MSVLLSHRSMLLVPVFSGLLICAVRSPCAAQGTEWSAGVLGALSPESRLPPLSVGVTIAREMMQGQHSSLRIEVAALTPIAMSDLKICTSACAPQTHVSQMAMALGSWLHGGKPQSAPRGAYGALGLGAYVATAATFPGQHTSAGAVISYGFGAEVGTKSASWRIEGALRYFAGGDADGRVVPVFGLTRSW